MTSDERNRLITEKMELCWHEWDWNTFPFHPESSGLYCRMCQKKLYELPESPNPDYSTDANFLPLLRWAREQEWFGTFMSETCRKKHKDNDTYCSMTNEKITGLVRGPVHCRVMARREGE